MGARTLRDLVPVTVVAGYLGAGKTTLINELLAHDHGRRLAVLVNDFGAVNIDAALIADHDGQTISLKNGCVCCSIADELGDALDRVLALEPAPDQIVIEASGVADPANVAAYGQGWPGCRLDAVVVLADAETIQAKSRDQFVGELVVRQLRRADIVMATKCDLVTKARAGSRAGLARRDGPRRTDPHPPRRSAGTRTAAGDRPTHRKARTAAVPRWQRPGRASLRLSRRRGQRHPRPRPGRGRAAGLARLRPAGQGNPPVQRRRRRAPHRPESRTALEHRTGPRRLQLRATPANS